MSILLKELNLSTYESLKKEHQELEKKAFEAKRKLNFERHRLESEYFGNNASTPYFEYVKNHVLDIHTDDGYDIGTDVYHFRIVISKAVGDGRFVTGSGAFCKDVRGIEFKAVSSKGRELKINRDKKLIQIAERIKELYEEYAVIDPFSEQK